MLRHHNCYPIPENWGDAFIGLTEDVCLATVCGLFPHLAEAGDLVEEKQVYFRDMVRRRGPSLTTDAVRCGLARLRDAGIKLAVATNSGTLNARIVLEATGLAEFFPVVMTYDTVKNPKPHPDMYLAAAAGLGVAPGRCAAVEDSIAGLASASGAGCITLAVANTLPAADLKSADYVFDSTPAAFAWSLDQARLRA
ncbi:MAG: HAD family phosphatase [Planctomycetaceae bacterium]|nr:HAD family phosphatase [Planctomycetaceae bacterium]